jgi:hypothetical protein
MSEPAFDNSALRVVIKDLDLQAKYDVLKSGEVRVIIDKPNVITALMTNRAEQDAWVKKNKELMDKDPSLATENEQIITQVWTKAETYYMKVYGLDLREGAELEFAAFNKKGELILRNEIGVLLHDHDMRDVEHGPILFKIQNNLKILIVGGTRYKGRECDANYIPSSKYKQAEEDAKNIKLINASPLVTTLSEDAKNKVDPLITENSKSNILANELRKARNLTANTLLQIYLQVMHVASGLDNTVLAYFEKYMMLVQKPTFQTIAKSTRQLEQIFSLFSTYVIPDGDENVKAKLFVENFRMSSYYLPEYPADDALWLFDSHKSSSNDLLYDNLFRDMVFQALETGFIHEFFMYTPQKVCSAHVRQNQARSHRRLWLCTICPTLLRSCARLIISLFCFCASAFYLLKRTGSRSRAEPYEKP